MAGRNKILTEELIKKYADAIYMGAGKNLAADYVGVSVASIMNWQKLGEAEHARIEAGGRPAKKMALYLQFFKSQREALAELGIELLTEIQADRQRQGIASTWKMLQSKWRQDFGPQNDIQMTYDLTGATDEQLQRIANGEHPLAVLAGAGPGNAGTAPADDGQDAK